MTTAVPPDADTSGVVAREPYRDSCDGAAKTRGWTLVSVATRLATKMSDADLAAFVDQRLTGLGWHRTASHSASTGDYVRWEKQVSTGTAVFAINIDEHPHPDPQRPWEVSAMAPPAGKEATGC
jgi:hypothetical protein